MRAHLEEDAAKTVHAGGATGRSVGADYSLVDFNRGGTPLLEIVTEPDLRSADEADRFLRLLRQTIVELGISDAEMEKGTLRADVNVSVRERGEEGYRPRWEIKNMNSFTFIGRAIDAAVRQQIAAHEAGETVEQSTYDYEADTDVLTAHRSKEEADDYRYFPEPDLVPVEPPAELVERLRAELPELPAARIRRLEAHVGFDVAAELVSTGKERKAELLAAEGVDWRTAANVAMNRVGLPSGERARARRGAEGERHARRARRGVRRCRATAAIDADDYLAQAAVSDESALGPVIDAVLAANPRAGRDLPRRQGGRARLLRRPGDEGDAAARPTRRSSTGCFGRSCRRDRDDFVLDVTRYAYPVAGGDGEARVSEADRERAVERLREVHVDGRMTLEELSDRAELAYRARTGGELARATAALPGVGTGVAQAPDAEGPRHLRRADAERAVAIGADADGLLILRRHRRRPAPGDA